MCVWKGGRRRSCVLYRSPSLVLACAGLGCGFTGLSQILPTTLESHGLVSQRVKQAVLKRQVFPTAVLRL